MHAMSCGRHLLSWNEKLQLVINNRPAPRTNIVDLVQYILYPESEDAKPPRGFDTFLEGLKKIGLESQWLCNETVINALDNNKKAGIPRTKKTMRVNLNLAMIVMMKKWKKILLKHVKKNRKLVLNGKTCHLTVMKVNRIHDRKRRKRENAS